MPESSIDILVPEAEPLIVEWHSPTTSGLAQTVASTPVRPMTVALSTGRCGPPARP